MTTLLVVIYLAFSNCYRECAESILKFHRAARPGMLKVTYEKFMRADYSRVAAIKPLDKLPR